MEKRIVKISKNRAGGTAGGSAESFRISLPTAWVKELGIDNCLVDLSFDGNSIIIKKKLSAKEFLEKNAKLSHKIKKISYYDGEHKYAEIVADYTDKAVAVDNYSEDAANLPFGKNNAPTWSDYETFLAERCISRDRIGLREYLEILGLFEYDPIEIVKITQGRMAEDNIYLQIEEYE